MTQDDMETVLQLWGELNVSLSALAEHSGPGSPGGSWELLLQAYAARRKDVWPSPLIWPACPDRAAADIRTTPAQCPELAGTDGPRRD